VPKFHPKKRLRRSWPLVMALCLLAAGLVFGPPRQASAYPVVSPIPNPAQNVRAPVDYSEPCASTSGAANVAPVNTPRCTNAVLADVDAGRSSEGLPPMLLPANWYGLTTAQQTLAAINAERTARGLPAVTLLATAPDSEAARAAQLQDDPTNSVPGMTLVGGYWAAGFPNVLAVIFATVYQDGITGQNGGTGSYGCTTGTEYNCWGHRQGILVSPALEGHGCPMVAGAAVVSTTQWLSFTFGFWVYCNGQTPSTDWTEPSGSPSVNLLDPVVGMTSTPTGDGYWLVTATGAVTSYGTARPYGALDGHRLNAAITHIVATPDGRGYWLVAADGGVFNFGDASFFGSMGGVHLNEPVEDIAPTPDGRGYWLVAADGGVFSFGNAQFYGSTGALHLNKPVVGMTAAPDGHGYWLVAGDGGIFSFGSAGFYGSTGNLTLNQPVVGMSTTRGGRGYRFVSSDGGVFDFGDAQFLGSAVSQGDGWPVVGMVSDLPSGGYWLVTLYGNVFGFDAPVLAQNASV
jgi:hypothetical protein